MANSYGTKTTLGNAQGATSASYTLIGTIDLSATPPHELFLKMEAFTGASAGTANALCSLYVSDSLDNTTFADAPSATGSNSKLVGSVAQPTTGDTAAHSSLAFPVSPYFGGALPRYLKVYVYNGWGVALAAGAGSLVTYQTETFG
jgi:hypothetical protein